MSALTLMFCLIQPSCTHFFWIFLSKKLRRYQFSLSEQSTHCDKKNEITPERLVMLSGNLGMYSSGDLEMN